MNIFSRNKKKDNPKETQVFDSKSQSATAKMNAIGDKREISGSPNNTLMKTLFGKGGVMKILEGCDDGDKDFQKIAKKVNQKRKSLSSLNKDVLKNEKNNFFYQSLMERFSKRKNYENKELRKNTSNLLKKYKKEVLKKANDDFKRRLKINSKNWPYNKKEAKIFESKIPNFKYTENEYGIKSLVGGYNDSPNTTCYITLKNDIKVKDPKALVKTYYESNGFLVDYTSSFIKDKLSEYAAANEKAARKIYKATADYSSFIKLVKKEFDSYYKKISKRKNPTKLEEAKKKFAEICKDLIYNAPNKEEIEMFANEAKEKIQSEVTSAVNSTATFTPNSQDISSGASNSATSSQSLDESFISEQIAQLKKLEKKLRQANADSKEFEKIKEEMEKIDKRLHSMVDSQVARLSLNNAQTEIEALNQQAELFRSFSRRR